MQRFTLLLIPLLTLSAPFFGLPFDNANTRKVVDNINALTANGELTPGLSFLISSLSGFASPVVTDVIDQLHPAPYSAFEEMQAEVGAQLLALFHRSPYLPCGCPRTQRAWVVPFGNWLKEGNLGEQVGFQAITHGVAAGYDFSIGEYWAFGCGGTWNRSDLTLHLGRGKGEVDRYLGALYCDFMLPNFYLGFSTFGGWDENELTRHIQFPFTLLLAKGDLHTFEAAAQIATAYLFGYSVCLFYPYANFDFFYALSSGFSEHGADGVDLTVASRSIGTMRSEAGIGLQVQDTNLYETLCISPTFALGWAMECPAFRPAYRANFAGEPIGFKAKGWDHTFQLFTFDFDLRLTYRIASLTVEYRNEFSPDGRHEFFWGQRCNIGLVFVW